MHIRLMFEVRLCYWDQTHRIAEINVECSEGIAHTIPYCGIGKTELAHVVAQRLRDTFPDAQIVVPLQGASDEPLPIAQALRTVIHAFTPDARLPDDEGALQAHYRSALDGQRALILADDARDAAQVQPLLPPPGCALLVTSRQRFSLPGMTAIDLEQLDADSAVALLRSICDRLTAAESETIAQACGYLPLALRISGSILQSDAALPVASYLARLTDERERLSQLRDPDNPPLDVEVTLVLSYAQLDAATQQVFRQLGVLVADFAIDLALAVVEAPEGVDVEATLRLLLRRNLITYDAQHARWRLHDLLRDLARRELKGAGAWEATMWRYARATVVIAEQTQEQYLAGGEGTFLASLMQFDAERMHIDAAHRWAQLHHKTPAGDQLLLDLARARCFVEDLRYDQRQEILPLWEGVRTAAQRLGDRAAEARALANLGLAYFTLGELHTAISHYEQALLSFRELGDYHGEGNALGNLGLAYSHLGETHTAISYYEQDLVITHQRGDCRSEGITLANLGAAYHDLGEIHISISCYERALATFRELGDRRYEGNILSDLGNDYTDLGDTQRAIECCTEALSIARTIGERRGEGYALSYLARAQAQQGNPMHTVRAFEQAIACFQEVGDAWGEAECEWQFGLALARQGVREKALPLLNTALAYEQQIGHAKAAEHAALLARLEAGEDLAGESLERRQET